ncbi:hypothetical protein [Planctomicrobium piriforme]|uniref:Uncharacterized protein n=1 Tax=Planctomicrobium piriforme TaxID=1576369 RepID=A0A1I3AUT4_9PLAN|nr:hypothetical protein [Planctomicrobium piriforme]SFH53489.1 hypothetical protein SAMN05421753_10157 [Planctomicrobium piriforme]
MSPRKKANSRWTLPATHLAAAREALGYLNFSSGNSDPQFVRNLNSLWEILPEGEDRRALLQKTLEDALVELAVSHPAFANAQQAQAVIQLGLHDLFPAYRDFHADLLYHVPDDDFDHPYFYAVLLEAILVQGGPWEETGRILGGALQYLNDYVGYRPVAVLENGRKMDVYAHERYRPIPIYLSGAGVSAGRYHDLIQQTFDFLRDAPQDILHDSYFELERLEELVIDQRAYDHLHPVNKRTNYLFGEWDPHRIDNRGYYRRFVVRQIILDSLQDWIDDKKSRTPRAERLFDAAAALCGTMLMASSVSGAGPSTHDSTISLTTLLPIVARRRDEFYARVMQAATGERRDRLQKEEKKTQQPFGHVRQYLNMRLAGYGARQVQHRELAHLYAVMGYPDASRQQAQAIPAASIRMETEVECLVSQTRRQLDLGQTEEAFATLKQVPDLLRRGVSCGALVDPWNILGFQGQFPLFSSREDAIPDNRVETLLALMEQIFDAFSHCLGEAAARGLLTLREEISALYLSLAEWWDQFGSDVIEDLPDVSGQDSWEAATHVSNALVEWRRAGEAAGDITFWRQHVEKFQSAQSYALVVDALLQKKDYIAAMGLLMQWLSQLEEVGVECPQHSIFSLLIRWIKLISAEDTPPASTDALVSIRRMFDFLEANAEEWWSVPRLGRVVDSAQTTMTEGLEFGGPEEPAPEEAGGEDETFSAAYDDMVFRDSAADGNWGDTADGDNAGRNTEFEAINRELEPRLKFLNAVGQMWQLASARFALELHRGSSDWTRDRRLVDAFINWHRQSQRWQIDLAELMESVWDHEISEPSGDHDGNVEYDIQLQVKFYLLHQIITTLICLRNAERLLNGIIPDGVDVPRGTEQDRQLARVYRAVVQRDISTIRELLPALLNRLSRNPLLYIPLENGGEPGQILRTQALQSVIRFLLRELPRLGLLRETWHTLFTAFRMERKYRPKGQAITEFDRLFAIALRSTLESLVTSAQSWSEGEPDTEDLIDALQRVLEPYQWLWLEHSRTMRISAVDGVRKATEWEEISEFIKRYGHDLFHASQLTLGNVRAILHNGVDWFLDYLEEEQDPLRPIRLLDDLDSGVIDRDDAEWCLEQVYSIIVDRFDRFLEYNTTTTQSDYGEMIYSLLDFLRLEALYDRDYWNLTPHIIVHEVLVRHGLLEAAELREAAFEIQTADLADHHLADLQKLQRRYGMRMPTITDHLKERFVKPLAVNRILALVSQAVADAKGGKHDDSASFDLLREEVDEYLEDSWGSGVDVPDWLRSLEREVFAAAHPEEGGRPGMEADLDVLPMLMTREEFLQQARVWRDPLGGQATPPTGASMDGEE